MTNSISNASKNKLLGVVACACVVLCAVGEARADRKRVVVLAFEGPKAAKFHDDVVRMIRKTHVVVQTEQWNDVADRMNAGALSERNIKRVARKLQVDAVVEGRIEQRRDAFLIRLTLHDGQSGEVVGNPVDTKADGPRIDGRAQRDIKDELIDEIDGLLRRAREADEPTIVDDDEERPARKAAKRAAEDDEERPARRGARKPADDEQPQARRGFSKRLEDERGADRVRSTKAEAPDEDERPAKKAVKKPADDEDERPAKKAVKKPADDEDDERPAKRGARKAADQEDEPPPVEKSPAKKAKWKITEDKQPGKKPAATPTSSGR